MTEAQKNAKKKYLSKVKRMIIEFYPTESDMIAHIWQQKSKQTYIKNLIRDDMTNKS